MRKRFFMPMGTTGEDVAVTPDFKSEITNNKNNPISVMEVGNATVRQIQHWVDNLTVVTLFTATAGRRGFVIKNNGLYKIYIGLSENLSTLQKIGFPLEPKESFQSSLFQGDLYCIADNAANGQSSDVRVWDEQL